jgi:dimethylglycine dehydrogenase
MVGLELPVLAMEHMYLVTDEIPEVVEFNKATGKEISHVIDFGAESLPAPGGKGMVLGVYEQACVPWSPRTTPWTFGQELLQPDLDRIAPSLEIAFKHFPRVGERRHQARHQRPLHLRARRQSAGRPGAGPASNFWVRLRRHGRLQPRRRCRPGAVELDGRTAIPASTSGAWTWRASASWATRSYTNAKVRENYSPPLLSIRFPNEELPAARPHQTTRSTTVLLAQGAVMGDSWGMETPLWFAPPGVEPHDVVSFHRSNDFPHIGAECRAVREWPSA